MTSTIFEDYDVLEILGSGSNSKFYKVKQKTTSTFYTWEAITYEHYSEEALELLLETIEERKQLKHPYVLQVLDFIHCRTTKTIYLILPFCEYGNLKTLIKKCLTENQLFHEDFIWHVIYHLACALKLAKLYVKNLETGNVFIDKELNVKLHKPINVMHKTACNLNTIIYELCTLKLHTNLKLSVTDVPKYFSKELADFVLFLVNEPLSPDYILCHPTVLLKSRNPKSNIFVMRENDCDKKENYVLRLNNLKSREMMLRLHEMELKNREHDLSKRERKVALLELQVREKLRHAEVYLKRSRNFSTSSGQSSSSNGKKLDYEDVNTTLSAADCDNSVILPTAAKLDIKNIAKPSHFTRTMSERRIRFKGHSPLKDICSMNKHTKLPKAIKEIPDDFKENKSTKKSRKLFDNKPQTDDKYSTTECKRISWNDETKRQAFNLLRYMNHSENNAAEIKHTYL